MEVCAIVSFSCSPLARRHEEPDVSFLSRLCYEVLNICDADVHITLFWPGDLTERETRGYRIGRIDTPELNWFSFQGFQFLLFLCIRCRQTGWQKQFAFQCCVWDILSGYCQDKIFPRRKLNEIMGKSQILWKILKLDLHIFQCWGNRDQQLSIGSVSHVGKTANAVNENIFDYVTDGHVNIKKP